MKTGPRKMLKDIGQTSINLTKSTDMSWELDTIMVICDAFELLKICKYRPMIDEQQK